MYKCKYFKINELVNPEVLKTMLEYTAWVVFDPNLLKCADMIREKYGACTINVGSLTDCGLRAIDSKTGAKWSAHKFGRALDLHILAIEKKSLSKEEKIKAYNKIRQELLTDKRFDCLNFEEGISWLHIDTFNRQSRVFYP